MSVRLNSDLGDLREKGALNAQDGFHRVSSCSYQKLQRQHEVMRAHFVWIQEHGTSDPSEIWMCNVVVDRLLAVSGVHAEVPLYFEQVPRNVPHDADLSKRVQIIRKPAIKSELLTLGSNTHHSPLLALPHFVASHQIHISRQYCFLSAP